ncbi:MAG: hypothetical protein WCS87_18270, partial [Methylococcaceae bacterium]
LPEGEGALCCFTSKPLYTVIASNRKPITTPKIKVPVIPPILSKNFRESGLNTAKGMIKNRIPGSRYF